MKQKVKNLLVSALSGAAFMATGATSAGEVDFFVDMIVSDGAGGIESDYNYRSGGYPKTAKVQFEYYSWNYCRKPDDTTSSSAALCGFWNTSKGGASGARAHKTGEVVFWHGSTSGKNSAVSGATKEGYGKIEFDYLEKTASWSSAAATKVVENLQLPSDDVAVPYHICTLENTSPSYIGVYSFRVHEQQSENADPVIVHDYVPCCAQGVPALYDRVSQKIIFPTTDGFTLPMTNDVSVASGEKLHVSKHTAAQKTCTLAAGSELVFDGFSTLSPREGTVLPAEGTVTVSLPESRGFGRYELISRLPENTGASAFEIGVLPAGFSGVLKVDGTSLFLVLSECIAHPDALGTALRSDAHGYIDTGYAFAPGKTSRVELKFSSSDYGRGTLPGPTNTASARPLFGFWYGAVRSGARWSGTQAQLFGCGTDDWTHAVSAPSGEQSVSVDYNTGLAKWNSIEKTFMMPESGGCRFYLFNLYNGSGPFSAASSVFDLASFKVWEKDSVGTETLARDFTPCIDKGKPAIYDRVTGAIVHTLADTNGFSVSGTIWRVGVGGDADYRSEGEDVSISLGGDGYVLINRSTGKMFASGTGDAALFKMPAFAVEAAACRDESVVSEAVREFSGRNFIHDFAVGNGALLSFCHDAAVYLSGKFTLPEEGTVRIALDGIAGPGDYALVRGVDGSLDLSKFVLEGVRSGYAASLEVLGDSIVVHVIDDPAGSPRFVSSVLSDGSGWFDTGYFYKGVGYPKTSKLSFDFVNFNYSRMPGATAGFAAQFGFWGGSKSTSMTRSHGSQLIVYYSDGASGGVSYNGTYVKFPKSGRVSIDLDYIAGIGSISHGSVTDMFAEGMDMVEQDATLSYYLCGCNGNNSVSYLQINSFKIWEKTSESGDDVLAVDCVPCVSAGKAGLYDRVRRKFLAPVHPDGADNGFRVSDWGGIVTQRHESVTTVSPVPVSVPGFAPQGTYTFTADGTVAVLDSVKRIEIAYFAADGSVTGRSTIDDPVPGLVLDVALGDAATAVVSVERGWGASVQNFGPVRVMSSARALCRSLPKGRMELMVAADAELTFASETGAVEIDSYGASGELLGSLRAAEFVRAGVPFAVSTGDADYLVLRISGKRRGLHLNIR